MYMSSLLFLLLCRLCRCCRLSLAFIEPVQWAAYIHCFAVVKSSVHISTFVSDSVTDSISGVVLVSWHVFYVKTFLPKWMPDGVQWAYIICAQSCAIVAIPSFIFSVFVPTIYYPRVFAVTCEHLVTFIPTALNSIPAHAHYEPKKLVSLLHSPPE